MLNWKVVAKSLCGDQLRAVHRFWLARAELVACVVAARGHAARFFKWLSLGSFVLGLIEASLYGAWAGVLYSTLYNYFAREGRDRKAPVTAARTA